MWSAKWRPFCPAGYKLIQIVGGYLLLVWTKCRTTGPGVFPIPHLRYKTLQWRHDERDGVSNHRRLDCLLDHLFRHRLKKTSKLHIRWLAFVRGIHRASNAENVSIWLRHHVSSLQWLYTDFWQQIQSSRFCSFYNVYMRSGQSTLRSIVLVWHDFATIVGESLITPSGEPPIE